MNAASLEHQMHAIGRNARSAAKAVRDAPAAVRSAALTAMARRLRQDTASILAANAEDIASARAAGRDQSFLDRLALDPRRLEAIAASVDSVSALPDLVNEEMTPWSRPNGLRIARVRTPLVRGSCSSEQAACARRMPALPDGAR